MEVPEAYQIDDGEKVAVHTSIEMTEGDLLAYHVEGSINPDLPLVIDPTLEWGTFFDGDQTDFDQYLFAIKAAPCTASATPFDFCVYAAGVTDETIGMGSTPPAATPTPPPYITPQAAPFQPNCLTCGANSGTNVDAIVYVLAEDGSTIYYATHFGGNGRDEAFALAVARRRFAGLHRRYHRQHQPPRRHDCSLRRRSQRYLRWLRRGVQRDSVDSPVLHLHRHRQQR